MKKLERPFEAIDLGGMRSERRKWPSVMRAVDCAVFVVALSEWSLNLAESRDSNRMSESLELYTATHNELTE